MPSWVMGRHGNYRPLTFGRDDREGLLLALGDTLHRVVRYSGSLGLSPDPQRLKLIKNLSNAIEAPVSNSSSARAWSRRAVARMWQFCCSDLQIVNEPLIPLAPVDNLGKSTSGRTARTVAWS